MSSNGPRRRIRRATGLSAAVMTAVGVFLGGATTALAAPTSPATGAITASASQLVPNQGGGGGYGYEDGYNSGTRCEYLSSTNGAALPSALADNLAKAQAGGDPTAIRLAQTAASEYKANFGQGYHAGADKVGCAERNHYVGPNPQTPQNAGPSNQGPSNRGPSMTGPSNNCPSNACPSNTGPSNTGPSTTGPSNTGPSNTTPSVPCRPGIDPACSTIGPPSTTGPSNAGPSTTGPSNAGPSTTGPSNAGPSTTGPSNAGPSTTGPSTTGQ
jgi:hypothetical protein